MRISFSKRRELIGELHKVLSRKDGLELVERKEDDTSPKPLVVYPKGVSDQTIADRLGVTKNIVAGTRSTYFGDVRDWSGSKPRNAAPAAPAISPDASAENVVRQLIGLVSDLTKRVVELEKRFDSAPLFARSPK